MTKRLRQLHKHHLNELAAVCAGAALLLLAAAVLAHGHFAHKAALDNEPKVWQMQLP